MISQNQSEVTLLVHQISEKCLKSVIKPTSLRLFKLPLLLAQDESLNHRFKVFCLFRYTLGVHVGRAETGGVSHIFPLRFMIEAESSFQ